MDLGSIVLWIIVGGIAGLLADLHLTLASVELGTGGLISGRLAGAHNPSFRGGLVLSDFDAMHRSLSNAQSDELHQAAVIEAARGIRNVHHSDLALAALLRDRTDGPGLQLFAALVSEDEVESLQRGFGGHSGLAAQWASNAALGLVWKVLKKKDTVD